MRCSLGLRQVLPGSWSSCSCQDLRLPLNVDGKPWDEAVALVKAVRLKARQLADFAGHRPRRWRAEDTSDQYAAFPGMTARTPPRG